MDELTTEIGPLNPYARTFFWLWGLAALALIGFRNGSFTHHQGLGERHIREVLAPDGH